MIIGDVVYAYADNGSTIMIEAGDDAIVANAGNNNFIYGDVRIADANNDSTIMIEAGDDAIVADAGEENRITGDVDDADAEYGSTIIIEAGDDEITSLGNSDDTIIGDIDTGAGDVTVSEWGNDEIIAVAGDDEVFGDYRTGFDEAVGGDDWLVGVNPDSASPGIGEVDQLTGNGGEDLFVLGDEDNFFYVGNGDSDFANILDFDQDEGDKIQLKSSETDYLFNFDGTDTKISLLGTPNDLVGSVIGVDITAMVDEVVEFV